MSITDELRAWAKEHLSRSSILAIADRIDAEHEELMAEQFESLTIGMRPMTDENMAEHGWMRMPVDADGVPIRVGDKVYQVEGGWVYTVESITFYPDNTTVSFGCEHGFGCDDAHNVRHYHAPTVEDVLREFAHVGIRIASKDSIEAGKFDFYADEEAIANFAAKLRLAGDDE